MGCDGSSLCSVPYSRPPSGEWVGGSLEEAVGQICHLDVIQVTLGVTSGVSTGKPLLKPCGRLGVFGGEEDFLATDIVSCSLLYLGGLWGPIWGGFLGELGKGN